MHTAAFIDRDGVINEERGYVHKVGDFSFLPGAIEGLRRLQDEGYILVIVTNQAGIARGYYSEEDFHTLTSYMLSELKNHGVHITATYYCPHHPNAGLGHYKQQCDCRKPRPGMILCATAEHNIDLSKSVLIGDKLSDIEAGRLAGVGTLVLVESGHRFETESANSAHHVSTDLDAASMWITTTTSRQCG